MVNNDIFRFLLKTAVLLNHCTSLGVFPNQLKVAKVITVYKSGPSNDLQNYRPISLFSSLSKTFEKIILRRLVSFLERNNLIIPSQFGFRVSDINTPLFIQFYENIEKKRYQNIEKKRFSALIFLDIKKAFDSVCHEELLKKLE